MTPPNITEATSYPEPTASDLIDPMFETIWQAIKNWDISRGRPEHLYSGPTGNDVMHILMPLRLAIDAATQELEQEVEELETVIANVHGEQKQSIAKLGLSNVHDAGSLKSDEAWSYCAIVEKHIDQLQQSNTKLTERVKELERKLSENI